MENWQNNPYIDKLAGVPRDHEDKLPGLHEHIVDEIEQLGGMPIEHFEREKTEKDIELIHFAEASVDSVLARYGRTKVISVPLNNIHVLEEGGTREHTDESMDGGSHSAIWKNILIDRSPSDIQFLLKIFHEMLHLKCYSALQVVPGKEGEPASVRPYRSGIGVFARDGKTPYLEDFEEGVIGYLTSEFFETVVKNDPRFAEEIEKIASGELRMETGRKEETEKLDAVIGKIVANDPSLTREGVLDIFIDAQVNGRLFPLARLGAKAAGTGALRKANFES